MKFRCRLSLLVVVIFVFDLTCYICDVADNQTRLRNFIQRSLMTNGHTPNGTWRFSLDGKSNLGKYLLNIKKKSISILIWSKLKSHIENRTE